MGTAWIKDGHVLVDESGKVIICDECPCDEETVSVDCCAAEMPSTLNVTLGQGDPACPAEIDGTIVPIIWNGSVWTGDHTFSNGDKITIQLRCPPGGDTFTDFEIRVLHDCGEGQQDTGWGEIDAVDSCDPFAATHTPQLCLCPEEATNFEISE